MADEGYERRDNDDRERHTNNEMLTLIAHTLAEHTRMLFQMERIMLMTQSDIDALTGAVNTDRTAIATVVAQLNALIAAGQPVQIAELQAAVAGLTSDIAGDAPGGTPPTG